jgi:hypothetical protein
MIVVRRSTRKGAKVETEFGLRPAAAGLFFFRELFGRRSRLTGYVGFRQS